MGIAYELKKVKHDIYSWIFSSFFQTQLHISIANIQVDNLYVFFFKHRDHLSTFLYLNS
jgi:hypothetical protein